MVRALYRWPVILLVLHSSAAVAAQQQPNIPPATIALRNQEAPLPTGQRITAGDGDTVVIEGDARVRIVRRRPAFVRIVANAEQRFVILLTENLREHGDSPTRVSEKSYAFNGLQEPWPFAPRWEGPVWLEEYFPAGSHGLFGGMLGIETPHGKIVFGNLGSDLPTSDDARTVVVRFQGMSGGGGRQPFDQEEARVLALAAQNAAGAAQWQSPVGGMNGVVGSGGVSWFGTGSGGIGVSSETFTSSSSDLGPPLPAGAVRASANGAVLRKVRDVAPVMPEAARAAGIRGIVILEATIAADGTVSDARVLRSIPQLDQAAIDAVRQWRYEPMQVSGQATPVIVTVTVPFPPSPR
jgi:TonB family protein